jgi:hypothetical protein
LAAIYSNENFPLPVVLSLRYFGDSKPNSTSPTRSGGSEGQVAAGEQNLGRRGCLAVIGGLSSDQRGRTRISPYHPSIG